MDVFKLRPGLCPIHKISRDQFEAATGKMAPWYQLEGDKIVPVAVCPACDNPIRIVALYERHEKSPAPYGKHSPKHIAGLADYNHTAYEECPYANPGREMNRTMLRPESDVRGRDILQLLREQFDRVIHLLQRDTGVRISDALAKKMLDSFLGMRGHLYVGTNLCNLPWMFGYMTTSQTLYGRIIAKDSDLMDALRRNRHIKITDESKITASGDNFVDINFCFMHHKVAQIDSSFHETVNFIVTLNGKAIFEKKIEVDPMHFHNLVNLPPERAMRNQRLLDIAAEMISI